MIKAENWRQWITRYILQNCSLWIFKIMLLSKKCVPMLDQIVVDHLQFNTSILHIIDVLWVRFDGRILIWEVQLPILVHIIVFPCYVWSKVCTWNICAWNICTWNMFTCNKNTYLNYSIYTWIIFTWNKCTWNTWSILETYIFDIYVPETHVIV